MSKKHRNWKKHQRGSKHHEEPTDQLPSEKSVIETASVQPNSNEENKYADEKTYRQAQLSYAKWLNIISAIGGGIALFALFALIWYASISKGQLDGIREANRINKLSSELAYRPYIGQNGIGVVYDYTDSLGTHVSPVPTNKTNGMYTTVEIKNFGPVPGLNFTSNWRVIVGGRDVQMKKLPDTPSTLFPGQISQLKGHVRGEDYKLIVAEKITFITEVTVEYDGPSGHYKECTKSQLIPNGPGFVLLGACTDSK